MKKRDRLRKKHAKMTINEYRKLYRRGTQHATTLRTTTASIAIGIYRIITNVRIKLVAAAFLILLGILILVVGAM